MPVDARVRVLSDDGGDDERRADRRVSRSQRRRDSRHLRVAAGQRQVDRRPTACHNDNWKIAACPVNGPTLSARRPRRRDAWFTVKNEQRPRLRGVLAGRRPHIRRADSPRRGGTLGRVDVVLLARRLGGRDMDRVRRQRVAISSCGGSSASGTRFRQRCTVAGHRRMRAPAATRAWPRTATSWCSPGPRPVPTGCGSQPRRRDCRRCGQAQCADIRPIRRTARRRP